MMSLRAVGIASRLFFWAFVTSVSAGEVDRAAAAPVRAWDDVVSTTLFADIADFELEIRQEAGERIYVFLAIDGSDKLLLSVAVAIAPAGSRLPSADFRAAVEAADPATRARDFPEIGARARAEPPHFSPDGILSGVIFATGDSFFDVVVSVFEASSSVERPPLTAEDAAQRIEAAYDTTRS